MIFISNPESSRCFFHCILCKDMGNRARIGCRQYIKDLPFFNVLNSLNGKKPKGFNETLPVKKGTNLKINRSGLFGDIYIGYLLLFSVRPVCFAMRLWYSYASEGSGIDKLSWAMNIKWFLRTTKQLCCSFIRLQWLYLYLSDNSYH